MQQVYSTLDVYSNNVYLDVYLDVYFERQKLSYFSRYYKNSVCQKPGWNEDVIEWCAKEAKRQDFKPHDYWDGFIIDEMKLQVNN